VSGSSDVGFAVPGGDPARLYDAARWHELVADDLDGHAALIDHTAGSLSTAWRGKAAGSYHALSGAVAAHFRTTADSSRSAAATLQRYAHELDGYQQEARRCLAEAEHWQQQVVADRAKLVRAQQALRAAEEAVAQAQHQARAAASAGTAGAAAQQAATATLTHARSNLTDANATVRDAELALHHAEDELGRWQARGRQVWQQAQDAGSLASRTLGCVSVSPPPSAAAPATAGGASPGAIAVTVAVGGLAGPAGLGATSADSPGSPGVAGTPGVGIPAAAATPVGAGTTAGGPSLPAVNGGAQQGAVTFGDLEEIGRRFGWSHGELEAWWQVISDESGGNPGATNPGSGAFGIGQFLGATYKEYLPFGAGSPNPLDQLNAMAQYIHDRYGNPLAALAHENSCHWY
jgi:hypothetical protein